MSAVLPLAGFMLRQRLRGLRSLPTLAVASIPAVIPALAIASGAEGEPLQIYGRFLAPMCLYFVLPFVAMFTMLPTLGAMHEKGAVAYLYTRPCPRWGSMVGLWLGGLVAMLPALLLGALAPALVLGSSLPGEGGFLDWCAPVTGLAAVLAVGAAAYGAICLFLGVWSRRALLWALFVLMGWGSIAGAVPGTLRATSPHRYLFALMRSWCGFENGWEGLVPPDPSPPADLLSLAVLAGICALALLLAWRAALRRDIL